MRAMAANMTWLPAKVWASVEYSAPPAFVTAIGQGSGDDLLSILQRARCGPDQWVWDRCQEAEARKAPAEMDRADSDGIDRTVELDQPTHARGMPLVGGVRPRTPARGSRTCDRLLRADQRVRHADRDRHPYPGGRAASGRAARIYVAPCSTGALLISRQSEPRHVRTGGGRAERHLSGRPDVRDSVFDGRTGMLG